jgi:para-aminobenzoate synthetase / 4-amino-4-deoxychorismate lyase
MPIDIVNKFDIRSILRACAEDEGTVVLETNKSGDVGWRSFAFTEPHRIISCFRSDQVIDALADIEREVAAGKYAAGYISFEAGCAFEGSTPFESDTLPLLWFGIYTKAEVVEKASAASRKKPDPLPTVTLSNTGFSMTKDRYEAAVRRIQEYIAQGDTYQVNLTMKTEFDLVGSPLDFFEMLSYQQHVRYAAFLNLGRHVVLSLSPELFFRIQGNHIVLRPMKGTIRRGRTRGEDAILSEQLRRSAKDQSENLMIVDMLRNDVGRIAEPGSVEVSSLYEIEQYDTLFQMTSTIEAERRAGVSLAEVFRALFPPGSVVGAPKIRTLEIIRELEGGPRSVYTGAIGCIGPDNQMVFNVGIRTVVIDRETHRGSMGIGSGIVNDSVPEKEFEECLLKARFLTDPVPEFQLIETMAWDSSRGYFLLDLHLERLQESALYFDIPVKIQKLRKHVIAQSHKFGKESRRVRLSVMSNGTYSVQSSLLEEYPVPIRIRFSSYRTNSADRFLFHKTSNRALYDKEFERARADGFFDCIFINEHNEVTEGTITNIFIRRDGKYFTPPVDCGVLDGVFRRHLHRSRIIVLTERILTEQDIRSADEVYLCNSVRGIIKVDTVE